MSHSAFQNRRMVVFAGPHKSASSSVQELFVKYADSRKVPRDHHPSLVNWTWPWNPRRRSYLPRKGFAPLVTEEAIGFHELIWETLREVWQGNDTNLIWGTEELDRFGPTPWSHRNGLQAIWGVLNATHPQQLDVVVNYRRPRHAQWISIWKQLTRSSSQEYAAFLCDPEEATRVWEYLDCVANPLGFVQALLDEFASDATTTTNIIHVLDMQGIAQAGGDVGHVMACQVLGVKCNDDWLPDIVHPILQNQKSGNPGLTNTTLQGMEWLLRQRDCAYRTALESHRVNGRLVVHYGETLWNECLTTTQERPLSNTTYVLELLQSQAGCGPLPRTAVAELQHKARKTPLKTTVMQDLSQQPIVTSESSVQGKKPLSTATDVDHLIRVAQTQLVVLYLMLVVIVGMLVRRLKCRHHAAKRRLAGRHSLMTRSVANTERSSRGDRISAAPETIYG